MPAACGLFRLWSIMRYLHQLIYGLLLAAVLPTQAQIVEVPEAVDSNRVTDYDWACFKVDADGNLIEPPVSKHQRQDTASIDSCMNRKLADPEQRYDFVGGRYTFVINWDVMAQQVGLFEGTIQGNLKIPVWDGYQDLFEVNEGESFSLDVAALCSVPNADGSASGAGKTVSLASGSVSGLTLSGGTYSGTPDTPGLYDLVFQCVATGGRSTDALMRLEVFDVPVPEIVLGQPVVVSFEQVDVPLATPWDTANTPVSYSLERSTDYPDCATGFSSIASGTAIFDPDGGYSDTTVSASTSYCYQTIGTDSLSNTLTSDPVTATTPADPGAGSPPGGNLDANFAVATITETTFGGVSWDAVPDSDYYRFLVRNAVGGEVLTGPSNLVFTATTDTNSFDTVTGLATGQQYGLRRIPGNEFGEGTVSDWEFFTTDSGDPGGACELKFGPWDHASENVGIAQDVSGIFKIITGPSSLKGTSALSIRSTDPMVSGEKYYHTICDKSDGCVRTERKVLGELGDPMVNTSMIDAGGDDLRATEVLWYGFLMRIDEATVNGPTGYYWQWHSPSIVGNSSSPHHGIKGRQDGVAVYRKIRANNAAKGDYEQFHSSNIFSWPAMKGETHAYIFKTYWDGRSAAEGSQGIFEVYVDDNPTAFYTFNGERNITYGKAESDPANTPNAHPHWKFGLYQVDNIQGIYEQSYSRTVVGGADCTRSDIVQALNWSQVVAGTLPEDALMKDGPKLAQQPPELYAPNAMAIERVYIDDPVISRALQ